MTGEHPLKRAFELANSGECKDLVELERQLQQEHYLGVLQHLSAPSLRKQLLEILRDANKQK